jgi:hypothetical protein
MTDTVVDAWIPAALVQYGELVSFPAGTLVAEPATMEGGAVRLFLRVTLGEEPGLLQLSPAPGAPTGSIFGIDEDEMGFGVVSETTIKLECDLNGGHLPARMRASCPLLKGRSVQSWS